MHKKTVREKLKGLVPEQVKTWIRPYCYGLFKSNGWYRSYFWEWGISVERPFQMAKRKKVYEDRERRGISNIPIFLISFNRLSYLRTAIERFEQMGLNNIIVIDNASTYPPLLEYYKTLSHKVITLDKNYGHRVFWECPELQQYRNDFYIVSDPDVIPIEECPNDLVEKMFFALKRYPNVSKVGISLKLNDLPEQGTLTASVLSHEQRVTARYIKKNNLYVALVDTTFAIYPPDSVANKNSSFFSGLRTGYPYQARHLPWYKKKEDITEEDRFYFELNKFGTWDFTKPPNE